VGRHQRNSRARDRTLESRCGFDEVKSLERRPLPHARCWLAWVYDADRQVDGGCSANRNERQQESAQKRSIKKKGVASRSYSVALALGVMLASPPDATPRAVPLPSLGRRRRNTRTGTWRHARAAATRCQHRSMVHRKGRMDESRDPACLGPRGVLVSFRGDQPARPLENGRGS